MSVKVLMQPIHVVYKDCVLTVDIQGTGDAPEEFCYVVRRFDDFYYSNVPFSIDGKQWLFCERIKASPFELLKKHDDWLKTATPKRRSVSDPTRTQGSVFNGALDKEDKLALYKALHDPVSLYISDATTATVHRAKGTVLLRPALKFTNVEDFGHHVLWKRSNTPEYLNNLKPHGFLHFENRQTILPSKLYAGSFQDRIVADALSKLRHEYINVSHITLWSFCN